MSPWATPTAYEIVAENVSGFSAPAYATVSVLGAATLSLDNAGNLAFTVSPGVPDRLSVQLAAGIYTLTDPAVTIAVTGAGAGFVTGAGTSTVTIPAADVSAMTLDTSDNTDTITYHFRRGPNHHHCRFRRRRPHHQPRRPDEQ